MAGSVASTALQAATMVVRRKSVRLLRGSADHVAPRAPLPRRGTGACCTSSSTEAAAPDRITLPSVPATLSIRCPPRSRSPAAFPSADILPVADLREAASTALEREPALALSYSSGAGHPGLRSWIAGRHRVDASRVVCTNGSLQALLFVAEVLLRGAPNRRVLVEAPTYDRAIIVLRRAGAEVGAVAADEHGLNVDALQERIERDGPPALLYVIPNFQNPSGVTLPLERRERLVALSREHGFRILEDDPYGLLRWSGERVPSLFELDGGENVVALSSFTKTVAPGLRVGYAIAPEGVAADLTKHANDTYIAPSMLSQSTLHAYCEAGRFEPGVQRASAALQERCEAMAGALREHFPRGHAVRRARGRLLHLGRPARGRRHRPPAGRGHRGRRAVRQGSRLLRRRRRDVVAAAGVLGGRAGPDPRGHRPPRRDRRPRSGDRLVLSERADRRRRRGRACPWSRRGRRRAPALAERAAASPSRMPTTTPRTSEIRMTQISDDPAEKTTKSTRTERSFLTTKPTRNRTTTARTPTIT